MRDIEDFIKTLPPEQQAAINKRSAELINEVETLKQMRKARALTQKKLARKLGVGQVAVSKLESRSDLLLSTLRSYIEAMGGTLDLVVRFPDRQPVTLSTIGVEDEEPLIRPARKKLARKPLRKAVAKKPARKLRMRQAAE